MKTRKLFADFGKKFLTVLVVLSMLAAGLPNIALQATTQYDLLVDGTDFVGFSTGMPSDDDPTLIVGKVPGEPGEITRVPVTFRNNPGIAGFRLTFTFGANYMSLVNFNDASIRSALGGSIFISNIEHDAVYEQNILTVVWASPYEVNSEHLFYLDFLVNPYVEDFIGPLHPDVPIGSIIWISIEEMKQIDYEDVSAHIRPGLVMLNQNPPPGLLWGDVNEDGVVNIFDLIRLAQHIAGTPGMELTGDGLVLADVFYDGSVNLSDLIHLARYLASEDMDNPDVILGPVQE